MSKRSIQETTYCGIDVSAKSLTVAIQRVHQQVAQRSLTCESTWRTQRRCGCSDGSCVRRSCAAADLPACADVGESWTPPWVSKTLSKCHRGITSRASGLVQIAIHVSQS